MEENNHLVTIGGMTVTADFINTKEEFKWRLVSGKETSEWTGHYAGVLVHTFKNGRTFGLCTQYWGEELTPERPFEIIKG